MLTRPCLRPAPWLHGSQAIKFESISLQLEALGICVVPAYACAVTAAQESIHRLTLLPLWCPVPSGCIQQGMLLVRRSVAAHTPAARLSRTSSMERMMRGRERGETLSNH